MIKKIVTPGRISFISILLGFRGKVCGLLISLLVSPSVAAQQGQAYQHLAQQEAQRAGDRSYDRALARAALAAGAYEHAIFILERIRRLYPNDMETRIDLVRLYIRQGDLSHAREVLDEIPLEKAPPQVRVFLLTLKQRLYQPHYETSASFTLQAGYDNNPGGASKYEVVQLDSGLLIYPQMPEPSYYWQYAFQSTVYTQHDGLLVSLLQRHYQLKHPSLTSVFGRYQVQLKDQVLGQLSVSLVRQTAYHAMLHAGIQATFGQKNKCHLISQGGMRAYKSNLTYVPGKLFVLGLQLHCPLHLFGNSGSSFFAINATHVYDDEKSPLGTEGQLVSGLQTTYGKWGINFYASWARQWDKSSWYKPVFGKSHRDLGIKKQQVELTYLLNARTTVGGGWYKNYFDSHIKVYQAERESIAIFCRVNW